MSSFGEEVAQALEKLGATAAEIAERLEAKGVKGYRMMGDKCPLAAYLSYEFPDEKLLVGTRTVRRATTPPSRTPPEVHLTREQVKFIDRFDHGAYPLLDNQFHTQ